MTSSLFTVQHSSAWVYYALCDESLGSDIDRRLAYLPPAGDTPPTTMGLAEAWRRGGVFAFLGQRPANDKVFLAAYRLWQTASAPDGLRFLWLANPNEPLHAWDPQIVCIGKATESGGAIVGPARVALRNYALVLERGCTVALDDLAPGFLLVAPESSAGKAYLTVEPATSTGRGRPPRFPLTAQGAQLALRGTEAGTVAFGFDLPPVAGTGKTSGFDALDVGCRYFYPRHDRPGEIASSRYPVFDGNTATVRISAVLDPVSPLGERTAFAIVVSPGDTPLASFFRTPVGQPIGLKPLPGAGLRFESRPASTGDAGASPLYLVPDGRFGIEAPTSSGGPAQLLCGTSAAEYVVLADSGSSILFVPHQAAFAPLFEPFATGAAGDAVDAPRLDTDATTSWVSLIAPEPQGYFAQPAGAVLYGHGEPGPAPTARPFLPFFPVPAGTLPAAAATQAMPASVFPLVPYAGVEVADSALAMAFETEVLSQERRQQIFDVSEPVEAPPRRAAGLSAGEGLTAVTPMGLVARFSDHKQIWESLTLARLNQRLLAFENVVDPLRSALLTNQQFLVISDPQAIAAHFSNQHCIDIQDWVFDLDPAKWQRHGTIMLIKNTERSIAELVADVGTWVLPEVFNRSPDLTQRQLERIIAEAGQQLAGHHVANERARDDASESGYEYFVNTVVNDPGWNGVLFLNCYVPPAGLPDSLRNLAAGLDEQRFFAHHLGINQTEVTGADLALADSSLFGLIAYADELRPPGAGGANYDFQVLTIEILFANSQIRHFSSSVAVTLMRLFGAQVTAIGSNTGNALVLDGNYQRRADRSVYVYRNRRQVVFDLADRIVRRVKLEQAEFGSSTRTDHTKAQGTAEDSGETAVAQFTFRGSLAFHELRALGSDDSFDLLSYDELGFSNLTLAMSYPLDAPRATRFRLDPTTVTFDRASARAGALASHFPVRPRAMIANGEIAQPSGLGFLTVGTPGLDATRLGPQWYGIVFDLDLGTPGALAGSVGFTASLAVVWSPSISSEAVYVGLRLPGGSGSTNQLSLMGVLKLTIYQLQLLHADNAFILKLTGMTLKLMGKTLPPGASFDFFLFGDPNAAGGEQSLGWYGAYQSKVDETGAHDARSDREPPALSERRPWSRALLVDAVRKLAPK